MIAEIGTQGLLTLAVDRDAAPFSAGQGARNAVWLLQISSEQRRPAVNGARPFGLRAKVCEAALRDLPREQPLAASRALPRTLWHRNAVRQQALTDPGSVHRVQLLASYRKQG